MKIRNRYLTILLMVLYSTTSYSIGDFTDSVWWDLEGKAPSIQKPNFRIHEDSEKKRSYTIPNPGTRKPPTCCIVQMAPLYETSLEVLNVEENLLNTIDRRNQVKTADTWPYRPLTQLTMNFGGTFYYGGSGVLIGPHHVLTAAHNVFDFKMGLNEVKKVRVFPTLHGTSPYREAQVARVYTTKQWIESEGKDLTADIALLVLNEAIGEEVGWHGLSSYHFPDQKFAKPAGLTAHLKTSIKVVGYPRGGKEDVEKDKDCKYMWEMSSSAYYVELELLKYDLDTSRGQSGSPVIHEDESHEIIGVHTNGSTGVNLGVYLSLQKLKLIQGWIEAAWNTKDHYFEYFHVSSTENRRSLFSKGWEYANKDDKEVRDSNPGLAVFDQREADRRALALFHRAAELGSADAANWIGALYLLGRVAESGIYKENREKATEWYRKAVDKGHIQARDNLAVMCQYREDAPAGYDEAISWLNEITNNDNATIKQKINAQNRIRFIGKLRQMLESAENEAPQAQLDLGERYSSGNGFLKNYDKAVIWLKKVVHNTNSNQDQIEKALEHINLINFLIGNIPEDIKDKNYYVLKDNYEQIECARNKISRTAHHLLARSANADTLDDLLSLLKDKIGTAPDNMEELQKCHDDLLNAIMDITKLLEEIKKNYLARLPREIAE